MPAKKLSREERIAALRKFRFTWHNTEEGAEVWVPVTGGWIIGTVQRLDKATVTVAAENEFGRTMALIIGYSYIRARKQEFHGDDRPLDPPEALAHA